MRNLVWTILLLAFVFHDGLKAAEPEPNVAVAKAWWPPQRDVWTPIGWRDSLFRFNVMYNGTVLCSPGAVLMSKANVAPYKGKDLQLNFTPSADGKVPPLPKLPIQVYKLDGGFGIQGWREDKETPVLWTEWPCQEGLVLRQEIFGHLKGGGPVKSGDEQLYAWIRLSVSHVDELRAPKNFGFAVQLSKIYYKHYLPWKFEDSVTLRAMPDLAKFSSALKSEPLQNDIGEGLRVLQDDGKVRVIVLPSKEGKVSFSETSEGSGIYGMQIELPVRKGAYMDLLVPMLAETPEDISEELALGFDGALKQTEAYWTPKPATAAHIHTPEPYINEALRRNIQFAQIVAEKDPETGLSTFLSGSYGYDVLWSTPSSMISHMFLDLLGYHDVVAEHVELYRKYQGSVKPPGPSYTLHPGYFSTPKTLTSFDWLTDHGAILEILSRHALLSGDQKFINEWLEPILKGCDFIKDSCANTNHPGFKGLMPPAVATDANIPTQAVWNQAWTYKGLTTSVELLKKLHHPRAHEFEKFAENFRAAFVKAFREVTAKQPRWTDSEGIKHPVLPVDLIPPPRHHLFDDCILFDAGPLSTVWAGLMNADDADMQSFVKFFREGPNTKLRSTRPNAIDRVVLVHEISSCEPCYSWNIVNSWQLGDREKFLEGMYSLFTGAISPETYISGEHRHGMYGTVFVAPLMTWCMRQAVIDDQLEPNAIHLLRLCPLAWISDKEETVFEKMPTEFGPVNLRFKLSADGKTLNVSFSGDWRGKPDQVVLHAPPVPGLKKIVVNGKRYSPGRDIKVNL
ncbi:MAG TPA: hypothetical protein VFW05_08880 [Verrucomicrobiae bacterium]|nr:hypothetical protein [Verrucomicrobiae bacterium]